MAYVNVADKETLDTVKSNTDTLKVNANTTISNIAEVKSIANNVKSETTIIKNNTEFLKGSMQGLKEESFLGTDGVRAVEAFTNTTKNILQLNGSGSLKHLMVSGARSLTIEVDGKSLTLKPKDYSYYRYYSIDFDLFSTDLFHVDALTQQKNSESSWVDTPTAIMWIPNLNRFLKCGTEGWGVEFISLYSNASSGRTFKTGEIYATKETYRPLTNYLKSLVYGGIDFKKSLSITFVHPESSSSAIADTKISYSYLYTLN